MTREEAIRIIRKMLACTDLSIRANLNADMVDACHLAINALEQEPSGDLISRQVVLDACEQSINILEAVDRIMDLPSVNPQEPKTGHWKRRIVDSGYNADWKCSECGYKVYTDFVNYNFCPNCGAKMEKGGEE